MTRFFTFLATICSCVEMGPSNRFLSSSNLLFATGRSQPIRIPSPHSPESRPDFNAVTSRTWFSSSATEEYIPTQCRKPQVDRRGGRSSRLRGCGQWFDMRDLDQILVHFHNAEIEICEGPEPPPPNRGAMTRSLAPQDAQ